MDDTDDEQQPPRAPAERRAAPGAPAEREDERPPRRGERTGYDLGERGREITPNAPGRDDDDDSGGDQP